MAAEQLLPVPHLRAEPKIEICRARVDGRHRTLGARDGRAAAGYRVNFSAMAPTPGPRPSQILYDFERARHSSHIMIVINTQKADFRIIILDC